MDKMLIIAGVQLAITVFVLYQLWSAAVSTRECQQSLDKVVVLLTVLANQQGATQADVDKALGK